MTSPIDRRRFLKTVGLGAATLAAPRFLAAADKPKRPNFVFFFTDDQTCFDVGCYGNESIRTPNVDKLAEEGMKFNAAFTGMALCAPSRSMLYTGLYPHRNGCFLNQTAARDAEKSVVHYLKPLGYAVALAGKTHIRPRSTFPFELIQHESHWTEENGQRVFVGMPVEKIDAFMREHRDEPFCLFVASHKPHAPARRETPYKPEDVTMLPRIEDTPRNRRQLTWTYGEIARADEVFGQVLALLDKHNLAENTVACFSSDHGGWGGKGTLYDQGVKVPLIVRWPGVTKPGSETDALVSFVDIVPTFVEAAGGKPPADLDGKSFVKVLKGEAEAHHEYVYGTTNPYNTGRSHVYPQRMVRSSKYKYIYSPNAPEPMRARRKERPDMHEWIVEGALKHPDAPPEELYDIEADPWELKNLADKPELQETKAELRKELFAWMKRQGDPLADPDAPMPLYEHATREPGWRERRRRERREK